MNLYEPPYTAQDVSARMAADINRLRAKAIMLHNHHIPLEEFHKDLSEFEEFYGKILYGSVVEQLDRRDRTEQEARLQVQFFRSTHPDIANAWANLGPRDSVVVDVKTFNEQYQCNFGGEDETHG